MCTCGKNKKSFQCTYNANGCGKTGCSSTDGEETPCGCTGRGRISAFPWLITFVSAAPCKQDKLFCAFKCA